jgi:nitrogen-specific signal transduction histidine kinase
MNVASKRLNLREVYDQIIKIIKPQLSNPNVKLMHFFDSNLPETIQSDKERIIRIAMNLLLNA